MSLSITLPNSDMSSALRHVIELFEITKERFDTSSLVTQVDNESDTT